MEEQESPRLGFVPSRLPWLVAAGALVLYLVTLNNWVTLGSVTVAAKVTGWDWSPALNSPIHFLITYPCRWLPAAWQLPVLNSLSALFACLTLALLARSVALLPHDRTVEQRLREHDEFSLLSIRLSFVPPLLAVLVCGLQLSFWENATVATGEMLDILLFAYVIRCLLEYRIDERESWFAKLALVYGAGITNNWALIGFFPLFVAATLWIRGRMFFQVRFLLRMLGLGTAGLLLYLLLPFLATLADHNLTFGKLLLTELSNQKSVITSVPRSLVLVLGLTSVLPILIAGIRWPSSFGDTSVVGSLFTNLMFRLVHAMLLVACLWLAFDSPFSPRVLGMGIPCLSFYYLSALSVGYFSGYFLLMVREPGGRGRLRTAPSQRFANFAIAGLVLIAGLGAVAALLFKNLPVIRALNGPLLRSYASLLSETVPARDAIILADGPAQLFILQAARHSSGAARQSAFVDTRMMNFALYQAHLNRLHPNLWPALPATVRPLETLDPAFLSQQLSELAASQAVHYLHPSFGFFFEACYLRPDGLAYRMRAYGTNALAPPAFPNDQIARNEVWLARNAAAWNDLAATTRLDFPTGRVLGEWYSRSLNYWGVELQRLGRLEVAATCFTQAVAACTNNLAASINLKFNDGLRHQKPQPVVFDKILETAISEAGGFEGVLSRFGPFDEPELCFRLGRGLAQTRLHRQAALAFQRTLDLDPFNTRARIELASACIMGEALDHALATLDSVQPPAGGTLAPADAIDVARLRALILVSRGDVAAAETTLKEIRQQHPRQDGPLASLSELYMGANRLPEAMQSLDAQLALNTDNLLARFQRGIVCMRLGNFDDAMTCFEFILKKQPGNLDALLHKAVVQIQTKKYKDAIAILDDILRNQPAHRAALMNRAIASLQANELTQAQADYETLEKALPDSHAVHYGLGTIAWNRKQKPEAIRHYERYLELIALNQPGVPLSDEAKEVQNRLTELKAAPR